MTPAQKEIQKSSKTAIWITNICEIGLGLGTVLAAVVTCLYVILYNRGMDSGAEKSMQETLLHMTYVYPGSPETNGFFVSLLVLNVVRNAALFAGFAVLGRMFRDISREGMPFDRKQTGRIRAIGWLAGAMTLVEGMIKGLEAAVMNGGMFRVDIYWPWLAFAAFAFCLAAIYDYGCQLQQESDETL